MSRHIAVSRADGVQTLRFDRPDKKNAITAEMYRALADGLAAGDADAEVGCHLFLGHPGAFSAGNDMEDFLKFAQGGELGSAVMDFLRALARSQKPMVAAVDGLAIGVGTTMLMHCDYVLATDRSVIRTPFVDLGLVPEAASSLLAPRIMGHQRAFELLVMGAPFSAERAREAGLVNAVVSHHVLEAAGRNAAVAIAAKPREAVAISRRLMRGASVDEVVARIDEEGLAFRDRLRSKEAAAAFMAFMAKRAG